MPAYLNTINPNCCNRIYNFQLSKQIYNRIQKHFSHYDNIKDLTKAKPMFAAYT